MSSIKAIAALSIAIGAAASAAAQTLPIALQKKETAPRIQTAFTYSYMRANAAPGQCGCFNLNGGSAEVTIHAYRNFSAVVDVTGEHAGSTGAAGQPLSLLSYTGGPRFSFPYHSDRPTRVVAFVQGLVGGVYGFDGQFPTRAATIASSANSLALLVGGGVDIAVSHRISIRAVQADYDLNHLPNNANNSENLLRVAAGVVLRVH